MTETKEYTERGEHFRIAATFGLHYIKGNKRPHFSITALIDRKAPNGRWVEDSGGCCHEEIAKRFPLRADIIPFHLGDDNGEPMHAEGNGFYWLAGALGGLNQQYHGGNSKQSFPIDPPEGKPWQTTEYREPTADECLSIFARYCRLNIEEARDIARRVQYDYKKEFAPDVRKPQQRWAAICEELRPRWKSEAAAIIARHELEVYGDPWEDRVAA